jgi:hypothetical protein
MLIAQASCNVPMLLYVIAYSIPASLILFDGFLRLSFFLTVYYIITEQAFVGPNCSSAQRNLYVGTIQVVGDLVFSRSYIS